MIISYICHNRLNFPGCAAASSEVRVEIALGRSEMEVPAELWLPAEGGDDTIRGDPRIGAILRGKMGIGTMEETRVS